MKICKLLIVIIFISIIGVGCSKTIDRELVAISNTKDLNGSFFLGSGFINDKIVYRFMHRTEGGGIYQRTVDVRRAVIYEGKWDYPFVTMNFIMGQLENCYFYIPENSVIKDFTIDIHERI
jgi:hypothetical protein